MIKTMYKKYPWSVQLTPGSMNLPAALMPNAVSNYPINAETVGESAGFDDTLEEFMHGQVPIDPRATGELVVEIAGVPSVPDATNNEIQFRLEFCAIAPDEDPATGTWVTTFLSGTLVTSATGLIDKFTWSESLSTLGIAPGDILYYKIVIDHTAVLTNPLVADWELFYLKLSTQRA